MPDAAETPLIGIAAAAAGMIAVRGDLADPAIAAAIEAAAGTPVPWALAVAGGDAVSVLWMSPDEVLVLCAPSARGAMLGALEAGLAGHHAMALDVSDARQVYDIDGALVGEVLAKGAPVDLGPGAFGPGTVRRTHLAGLAVMIWRIDAARWRIACARSYAHHLGAWLDTAARPGSAVESGLF